MFRQTNIVWCHINKKTDTYTLAGQGMWCSGGGGAAQGGSGKVRDQTQHGLVISLNSEQCLRHEGVKMLHSASIEIFLRASLLPQFFFEQLLLSLSLAWRRPLLPGAHLDLQHRPVLLTLCTTVTCVQRACDSPAAPLSVTHRNTAHCLTDDGNTAPPPTAAPLPSWRLYFAACHFGSAYSNAPMNSRDQFAWLRQAW
ncbi:hypothetical protein E2C01_060486 [Portunus trituberculatus]|uniref:Uncharacterized protein n=1 Tax=Portunus trituberculatus TaxID=210409 RepID=A0A5B7HBJ5_PORTR|nr:hypothetical protein [Portunus trituberculatus]